MSREDSLLPMLPTDQLKIHCAGLELHARMYWEKTWDLGAGPEVISHCQLNSSYFYAQARRVRAEAIRRTGLRLRSV